MDYSLDFKNVVVEAERLKMYIGEGNPLSKILVIGKELGQIENYDDNYQCDRSVSDNFTLWKKNIEYGSIINFDDIQGNNPLFALKGITKKDLPSAGHTWNKYQKINDLVFNQDDTFEHNFHKTFFITELNQSPAKKSEDAKKHSIQERISFFKNNQFYKQFPIVILACGTYIKGSEICDTFGVEFIENGQHSFGDSGKHQKFWIHHGINNTPKLVIHTRQLSGPIFNTLLEGIADEIKQFTIKNKITL